ncbi:MAG: iron-sulfur cluster assembly scaffold protein [Geminicoccaceae bacterium]|nr:iron-sulfur cluster assembly scaffold protein [Geminicoccaceae bacterium]MCS7268501.1 iron-sulfur cluster assembly scaffold protein [Geminicoccaceae bacterium]MCX8102493.1 iron-sulfur cluster assembly scaffold protein [Geminicoccaceae bacterium]MDW8124391.1 iron-sulfur cluster assembly scaffold protein [Geminicoccaceae bacterium]MDW8340837.1 iron-sulfur cluster assembly scaffold protein [Geminicoccaceae bacterium]
MSAELYHRAIVETAKETAEAARLPAPDVTVEEDNPLCGDRIVLDLLFRDGRVAAVGHKTRGCLLTRAAAAVLARRVPGCAASDLFRAIASLQDLLEGRDGSPSWPELAMFAPVRAVKSRHECVLLPFRALERALASVPPAAERKP